MKVRTEVEIVLLIL